MGSGASKSDTNGVTLPARFRPVFLQRIEEFTARRHNRLKDDATNVSNSKKELLAQERNDNDNASASSQQCHDDVIKTTPMTHVNTITPSNKHEGPKLYEAPHMKNERSKEEALEAKVKANDEDTEEDEFKDFDDDDCDGYDDENDERMIGNRDSDAFPGSPSFRVYFNDNGDDTVTGQVDDIRSTKAPCDDARTPEDSSTSSKQVKGRAKKKRSFKNVFPKSGQAAVKNLLNVTSCYTPYSTNERNRLLNNNKAGH